MENKQAILIVDDNPINIKVLMDSLNKPDYKLLSATNGQKALMINLEQSFPKWSTWTH